MLSRSSLADPDRIPEVPKEYRYLASVMGLPLVDGVFISIVISGGLTSVADSVLVGLFVLGGFATVSIILAEFDGETEKTVYRTAISCLVIGVAATLQAAIAPCISGMIDTQIFRYGAVLALLAVSVKILPFDATDRMIGPAPIVLVFVLLSFEPQSATLSVSDINYVAAAHTILAVVLATTLCIATVIFRSKISDSVDTRMLKLTTAFGLVALSLNIAGILPSYIQSLTMAGLFMSVDLDNPL